jgi:Tfp pilus assembly protein PilX
MNTKQTQREHGAVLVTSLIFLMMLTILSVTNLSTTSMEERMAMNSQEVAKDLQVADSGIQKMFHDDVVYIYGKSHCVPTNCSDFDNDAVDGPEYGGTGASGIGVKLSKTSGTEAVVGRSDNPKLMWQADKFSRYYFDLSVKATNLNSKQRKQVSTGALGIAKSSDSG